MDFEVRARLAALLRWSHFSRGAAPAITLQFNSLAVPILYVYTNQGIVIFTLYTRFKLFNSELMRRLAIYDLKRFSFSDLWGEVSI